MPHFVVLELEENTLSFDQSPALKVCREISILSNVDRVLGNNHRISYNSTYFLLDCNNKSFKQNRRAIFAIL